MILSLLVEISVASAATCLRREAHFSIARCAIQAKGMSELKGFAQGAPVHCSGPAKERPTAREAGSDGRESRGDRSPGDETPQGARVQDRGVVGRRPEKAVGEML